MFDLSIGKIVVLGLVALFVLGPERLPAAMGWLGRTIGQVKDYAAGARQHLEGPEFDELRAPLAELRGPLAELRALRDPRATLTRHLLTAPADTGPPHDTGPPIPVPGVEAGLSQNQPPGSGPTRPRPAVIEPAVIDTDAT